MRVVVLVILVFMLAGCNQKIDTQEYDFIELVDGIWFENQDYALTLDSTNVGENQVYLRGYVMGSANSNEYLDEIFNMTNIEILLGQELEDRIKVLSHTWEFKDNTDNTSFNLMLNLDKIDDQDYTFEQITLMFIEQDISNVYKVGSVNIQPCKFIKGNLMGVLDSPFGHTEQPEQGDEFDVEYSLALEGIQDPSNVDVSIVLPDQYHSTEVVEVTLSNDEIRTNEYHNTLKDMDISSERYSDIEVYRLDVKYLLNSGQSVQVQPLISLVIDEQILEYRPYVPFFVTRDI